MRDTDKQTNKLVEKIDIHRMRMGALRRTTYSNSGFFWLFKNKVFTYTPYRKTKTSAIQIE